MTLFVSLLSIQGSFVPSAQTLRCAPGGDALSWDPGRALRSLCTAKNSPCHFPCPKCESWGPAEKLAENISLMKNAPTSALHLKYKIPGSSILLEPSSCFIFIWAPRPSVLTRFLMAEEHFELPALHLLINWGKAFSPSGWWTISIHSTQPRPLHSSFPVLGVWQRRIPGHGKFSAAMEGKCWLLEILPDGVEHLCCSRIF